MLIYKPEGPKIVSIEAVDGYEYLPKETGPAAFWGPTTGDGYVVAFDNGSKLELIIDDGQDCCESWGYICSEDDVQSFIGAGLCKIETTDKALNSKMVEASEGVYEGGIVFVTLYTTNGPLQLAVYNCHNGYYGHPVWIRWAGTEVVSTGC